MMKNFDRYVYPGTNVLKNKQGITDFYKLEALERFVAAKNSIRIRENGIIGEFDVDHIKLIHKQLFGDVYDWAGEFRDIQIFKGGTDFPEPDRIPGMLQDLCSSIHDKNCFRGLSKDDIVPSFVDVMAGLNGIHPFREGNGRCQRMFLEQLALNAGYCLDFSKISENDMRDASRTAARGDNRLMRYLFGMIISYDCPKKDKKAADRRSMADDDFSFLQRESNVHSDFEL